MNYKAILFDLDGVLVLSEPVHYKAWLSVVREFSDSAILAEEDIIGYTDLKIAAMLKSRESVELTEEKLCLKKIAYFLDLLNDGMPAVKGRDLFLRRYLDRAHMAVVSSSSREEIGAVLNATKIKDYFKFYVGFEDTISHKPDPEPYLVAMHLLNCKPQDTLIIEDSPAGIMAAKKSGADVLGIDSSGLLTEDLGVQIFKDYIGLQEWLDFSLTDQ
jgi:beta-phosphoglucomutase